MNILELCQLSFTRTFLLYKRTQRQNQGVEGGCTRPIVLRMALAVIELLIKSIN